MSSSASFLVTRFQSTPVIVGRGDSKAAQLKLVHWTFQSTPVIVGRGDPILEPIR